MLDAVKGENILTNAGVAEITEEDAGKSEIILVESVICSVILHKETATG